jgi:hypothetical protein
LISRLRSVLIQQNRLLETPFQHLQPAARVRFGQGTLFFGAASLWTC